MKAVFKARRLSRPTQFAGIVFVTGVAAVVAAPWVAPGYIFGTDFAGNRHFDFPTANSVNPLLSFSLAVVSKVLGGELTAKFLILMCLVVAGLSAYRALPMGDFVSRAMAAAVYTLNPFVYDRLLYGQFSVLAGYAVLPFVALSAKRLILNPNVKTSLVTGLALAIVAATDLHMLFPAALLVVCLTLAVVFGHRADTHYTTSLVRSAIVGILLAVMASGYWLMPLLTGTSQAGKVLQGIGQADLRIFSVVPDRQIGLLPNLLGLYGFWAEDSGRFISMKAYVPFWPLVLVSFLLLSALGAKELYIPKRDVGSPPSRRWLYGLLVGGFIALILEIGVSAPITEGLVRFIDTVFPPYRGMRDSAKWAVIFAFVYSQLIPVGAMAALAWLRRRIQPGRRELVAALATGLLVAAPVYYGNGLLFGAHGQIQPSAYPDGWYRADRLLLNDQHPGRTLFLPWHLYMSLDFVGNLNKVVLCPAPTFFSVPVIVSEDPGLPGVLPPMDADHRAITALVVAGGTGDWAAELARRDIKFIVLARQVDWRRYGYLSTQQDLVMVADYGSIIVYRNELWHEPG